MSLRRHTLDRGVILALAVLLPAAARAQSQEAPAPAVPAPDPATPPASYEDLLKRVEALEQAAKESAAREKERQAQAEAAPAPRAASTTAGAFSQTQFNPEMSLIGEVALVGVNLPDAEAATLTIPGLLGDADRGGKSRGFDFNYLEMALKAGVDPYFDFAGVVTFSPAGVDVEETYVDTRSLPWGLQLRAGKFLSAFGRLNGMHKHVWDFYEVPLVYEALVGTEGLKNPGVRLSWTAPVDFLLTADVEAFQGVFDGSPTFDAVGVEVTGVDGTTFTAKAPFVPGLYAGSLKASFDVGDHVFLVGASVMVGHMTQKSIDGTASDWAYVAPATVLYDAELTYKYLISSYRSLTWQTEWLGRVSSGELALASDSKVHQQAQRQGGLYTQLVWRFDEPGQWKVGARLDLLAENSVTVDGVAQDLPEMLQRYSAMLEYSPTEFSRFRLQYAFDRSRRLAGVPRDVHEVLLQATFSIGPHGAHSF